jgi:hypothetical protein
VDSNDWLLLQAGLVLGMMIILGLAKRRSRKEGLQRFVKRHAKRQKYVKAALYEREKQAFLSDQESDKRQD